MDFIFKIQDILLIWKEAFSEINFFFSLETKACFMFFIRSKFQSSLFGRD